VRHSSILKRKSTKSCPSAPLKCLWGIHLSTSLPSVADNGAEFIPVLASSLMLAATEAKSTRLCLEEMYEFKGPHLTC
jgi:hypothetical protein